MKTSKALQLAARVTTTPDATTKHGDGKMLQDAAKEYLAGHNSTVLPGLRTKTSANCPDERIARLRRLALARGEYKTEGGR